MQTRTKSCGVTIKDGKPAIFHGKLDFEVIDVNDSKSVDAAEELVWKIRNEALERGQNYAKEQIKQLLGINI